MRRFEVAAPDVAWPGQPGPRPREHWVPRGDVDEARFPYGVQTGDALATRVIASCRPAVSCVVQLWLARASPSGWVTEVEAEGLEPWGGTVQAALTNLVPDTTYALVFATADGRWRSAPSRFRTALYPGGWRVVRLGAVSCLGRPGMPWPVLTHAAQEELDCFLLLGDTIYADHGPRDLDDHDGHWGECLRQEGMRALTASTSVVATWDDHEVDNNWSWDQPGMPDLALDALDAFRRHLPQRLGPGGSGTWRRLRWGDTLELFVLDCRGERIDGAYLGAEQRAWLKAGLLDSEARFKMILNSVPITDMDSVFAGIGAGDRWDGHPEERTEILDFVTEAGVEGVLWVAGDFHFGAVARVGRRPGDPGFDQHEIFAGPGGSPVNPVAEVLAETERYPVVVSARNVVLLEADPFAGTVAVRFVGEQGATLATWTLQI